MLMPLFFLQIYNESLLSHFQILVVQIILTKLANRVSTKFPYTSVTSGLRASRFVHYVISGLFMMNFLH